MNFHQRLLQPIAATQLWQDFDDRHRSNIEKVIKWARTLGHNGAEYVARVAYRFCVSLSVDTEGSTKWKKRAEEIAKNYSEDRIVQDFFAFAEPDNQFVTVFKRYLELAKTNQIIARELELLKYTDANGIDRKFDAVYADLNSLGEKISKLEKLPQGTTIIEVPDGKWVQLDSHGCEEEGHIMKHCFSGETQVVTYDGIYPIKDLVGVAHILTKSPNASGSGKWTKAEIKSFGVQQTVPVTLQHCRKKIVIRATLGHKWLIRHNQNSAIESVTTDQLEAGMIIPRVFAKSILFDGNGEKNVRLSTVGIMHGVVFGDGCSATEREGYPKRSANVTLYGKKDAELLQHFPAGAKVYKTKRSIGGLCVCDMPRFFKLLPADNECTSYLLGWLAGYFAADGKVSTAGISCLSSAKLRNVQFAEMLCQRFGIRTTGISREMRFGYGKTRSAMYHLNFEVGALPTRFYLLRGHRERARAATRHQEWTVKSVKRAERKEEVYCATVPGTHSFVLEYNLLTGNCGNMGGRHGDIMWSLRQPSNSIKGLFEPRLTFIYNPKTKELGEMKGKANTKPDSEYHRDIIALLKTGKVKALVGGGYRPEVNFSLNDLNDENFLDLFKAKPDLVKEQLSAGDTYQRLDAHHQALIKEPDEDKDLEVSAKKTKKPRQQNAQEVIEGFHTTVFGT